jgi:nitrogen fixation protein
MYCPKQPLEPVIRFVKRCGKGGGKVLLVRDKARKISHIIVQLQIEAKS